MASMNPEIVIGIDFGTTYSGVSWAVNAGHKVVKVITNWPNPSAGRNPSSDKVPTVIAYEDGKPSKWGYNVTDSDLSFRWFKLLLENETRYTEKAEQVEQARELLDQLNKQPVDVVSDYLRYLWDFTMREIERKQDTNFRETYTLKVVMSVPAMWSPTAKDRTLQAAKKAGLGEKVILVAEPEAAALATLKDKNEETQGLNSGDCFVICDAGGGTVDLISYEILQPEPLQVKECAIGTGGLCGSTYLDRAFQRWVVQKIGQTQWKNTRVKHRRSMLGEFENTIKKSFEVIPGKEDTVELRGIEDDRAQGIRDEQITVSNSVVQTIFDHVIANIKRLVQEQIDQVRQKSRTVKAVLLVGGFGESGYLHDQLKSAHSHQNISILQVNGAWSAICRGATMWGLEHSASTKPLAGLSPWSSKEEKPPVTVKSRIARYSYGVEVSFPFESGKHLLADRVWDAASNSWKADHQVYWLIKKGQEFEHEQVLRYALQRSVTGHGIVSSLVRDLWHVTVNERMKHSFKQELLYCSENTPPTRAQSKLVKPLCELTWNLMDTDILVAARSYKVGNQKYRDVNFEVQITLGNADLKFGIVSDCGDTKLVCEADFPDD